ncbi:MAG: trypsin-like peptidase domain-containing protein, partial [Gluconacetobacter diazotrophicus]|nr:trypsin-like peptidase domain-containing protein [Gluconacetobacter diazotrophicus]
MMLSRPGAGPLVAALAFGAALSVPLPLAARPAPDGFADLAARLLPSVVNVSTTETVSGGGDDDDADDGPSTQSPAPTPAPTQSPGPQASPGSPFEKLFRDFMRDHGGGGAPGGGAAPGGDPAKRRVQSLGSGFVIDPSGLIVTNQHVVKGAEAITVTLQDNTVLKAKVLGHDDRSDLALLKVDPPRPLPAVSFGNSDRVRVGDWVVAIGNPFGLSGTV